MWLGRTQLRGVWLCQEKGPGNIRGREHSLPVRRKLALTEIGPVITDKLVMTVIYERGFFWTLCLLKSEASPKSGIRHFPATLTPNPAQPRVTCCSGSYKDPFGNPDLTRVNSITRRSSMSSCNRQNGPDVLLLSCIICNSRSQQL